MLHQNLSSSFNFHRFFLNRQKAEAYPLILSTKWWTCMTILKFIQNVEFGKANNLLVVISNVINNNTHDIFFLFFMCRNEWRRQTDTPSSAAVLDPDRLVKDMYSMQCFLFRMLEIGNFTWQHLILILISYKCFQVIYIIESSHLVVKSYLHKFCVHFLLR